tara:strand:+ start:5139 stop:5366 length:228 start_codon:yes stop_codon:yes gene_type:complete
MDDILSLVGEYGLPLVLLLGAIYALYKFMVFSLYEVKNEFGKRHEENAQANEEIKITLAEIKSDLKLFIELQRQK